MESSFFPIPPDVMIVPMVIAKKNDYLKIFLIATFFSTLGGVLGYFIGSYFLDVGMHVVDFYGYEDKVLNLKDNLTEWDWFLYLASHFISCWFYTSAF